MLIKMISGGVSQKYGFIAEDAGTTYYDQYDENIERTITLPAASADTFIVVDYQTPQSGNFITLYVDNVQVFSHAYADGATEKLAAVHVKNGEVFKIVMKSFRTSLKYYAF